MKALMEALPRAHGFSSEQVRRRRGGLCWAAVARRGMQGAVVAWEGSGHASWQAHSPALRAAPATQAAAHLASMGGMTGMLLGSSPPPAAAMVHGSPVQLGPSFMGGPLSPGGGMVPPDGYAALLASMQQQAVTVSMLQQAGYVDPAAAGWAMPQGLDMTGLPMPLQLGYTTPPRRPRQAAHRTTPVGGSQRMSRFAPADAAVAAF